MTVEINTWALIREQCPWDKMSDVVFTVFTLYHIEGLKQPEIAIRLCREGETATTKKWVTQRLTQARLIIRGYGMKRLDKLSGEIRRAVLEVLPPVGSEKPQENAPKRQYQRVVLKPQYRQWSVENPFGLDAEVLHTVRLRVKGGKSRTEIAVELYEHGATQRTLKLVSINFAYGVDRIKTLVPHLDHSTLDPLVREVVEAVLNSIRGKKVGEILSHRRKSKDKSLTKLKTEYRQHITNPWNLDREAIELLRYRLLHGWNNQRILKEIYDPNYLARVKKLSLEQMASRKFTKAVSIIRDTNKPTFDGCDTLLLAILKRILNQPQSLVLPKDTKGKKSSAPRRVRPASEQTKKPEISTPTPPVIEEVINEEVIIERPYDPVDVVERSLISVEDDADEQEADRLRREFHELEQLQDEPETEWSRSVRTSQNRTFNLAPLVRLPTYIHPWKGILRPEDLFLLWENLVRRKDPKTIAQESYRGNIQAAEDWIVARLELGKQTLRNTKDLSPIGWHSQITTLLAVGRPQTVPDKTQHQSPSNTRTEQPPNRTFQSAGKPCPRCRGTMLLEEAWAAGFYATYYNCRNCGYTEEIQSDFDGTQMSVEEATKERKRHHERYRHPSHGGMRL